MTAHPGTERIAEYAQEALSGKDLREVEAHVSECRDCARLAERYAREAEALSQILGAQPPAPLVDRILSGVTPQAHRRSLLSWVAAAVVLMSLTLAVVAFRDASRSRAKMRDLERQVAGKMEEEDKVALKVLRALCRVEVERNVNEIAARAGLSDRGLSPLREALLTATSSSAEVFERAAMGEVEMDELLRTDNLAGVDAALRRALDRQEYERVAARLADLSREAAERTIDEFMRDLRTTVGLAEGQIAEIRQILIERSAWRRDLAFLPDFARRHYFVHVLRDGDDLRQEMIDRFSANQTGRVLSFLEREGMEYHKMWKRLKEKS